jgi:tyrosine-protein kinase Etk/Wzc
VVQVDTLRAHSGLRFEVVRVPRDAVIGGLKRSVKIREIGRQTGIIEIALEGSDPEQIAATLDAIARRYLRQNVERRSAEAAKTLEFLNAQLPTLKSTVNAAEEALNAYRSRRGTVDVSLETKGALEKIVDVEKELSKLEMQRSELRQRFTENHPMLQTVREQVVRMESERDAVNARMKGLPQSELELARLMRDVKVATELYVVVLNKVQELNVTKSGTIGNVRIVDSAIVPRLPVSPRKTRVVLFSVLMGFAAGVGLALAKRSLHRGLEDPEAVERATGLPVHAAIPHSAREAELQRGLRRGGSSARPLLAADAPKDPAVEALRSLRTSVEFALAEKGNNVITVGGPAPGIGKSFISVNLACVLADSGHRVLLVDADVRKGVVHKFIRLEASPGLTEVIAGSAPVSTAIRRTSHERLDAIPMGTVQSNPSELLGSQRFGQLVKDLAASYDVVLFDTPPILPVTDAALVARHAGVNLVVVKAGQHHARELQETVRRYGRNGVRPYAVVMNDVTPKHGRYGGYYKYEYE